MEKIKIPQVIVSYPGGAGGEWLGYQISQHPELFQYYHEEANPEVNEFNRWRIGHSWRAYMMDFTDWQEKVWWDHEYDGSKGWWLDYNENLPDLEPYYEQVKELIFERGEEFVMPVHRCHEAWQDEAWRGLFESLKTITIRVDDRDSEQMKLFQSNIIRKIWSQEFLEQEDLSDELIDKCKKFDLDYNEVIPIINKFSGIINYTDMMFALMFKRSKERPEEAIRLVIDNLEKRWNPYVIRQHWCELPEQHVLDYGKFFLEKDYSEYTQMCKFLEATPYSESEWNSILSEYIDEDIKNMTSVEEVKDRLWKRFSEI